MEKTENIITQNPWSFIEMENVTLISLSLSLSEFLPLSLTHFTLHNFNATNTILRPDLILGPSGIEHVISCEPPRVQALSPPPLP